MEDGPGSEDDSPVRPSQRVKRTIAKLCSDSITDVPPRRSRLSDSEDHLSDEEPTAASWRKKPAEDDAVAPEPAAAADDDADDDGPEDAAGSAADRSDGGHPSDGDPEDKDPGNSPRTNVPKPKFKRRRKRAADDAAEQSAENAARRKKRVKKRATPNGNEDLERRRERKLVKKIEKLEAKKAAKRAAKRERVREHRLKLSRRRVADSDDESDGGGVSALLLPASQGGLPLTTLGAGPKPIQNPRIARMLAGAVPEQERREAEEREKAEIERIKKRIEEEGDQLFSDDEPEPLPSTQGDEEGEEERERVAVAGMVGAMDEDGVRDVMDDEGDNVSDISDISTVSSVSTVRTSECDEDGEENAGGTAKRKRKKSTGSDEGEGPRRQPKQLKPRQQRAASKKAINEMKSEQARLARTVQLDYYVRESELKMSDLLAQFGVEQKPLNEIAETQEEPGAGSAPESVTAEAAEQPARAASSLPRIPLKPDRIIPRSEATLLAEKLERENRELIRAQSKRKALLPKFDDALGSDSSDSGDDVEVEVVAVEEEVKEEVHAPLDKKKAWELELRRLAEKQNRERRAREEEEEREAKEERKRRREERRRAREEARGGEQENKQDNGSLESLEVQDENAGDVNPEQGEGNAENGRETFKGAQEIQEDYARIEDDNFRDVTTFLGGIQRTRTISQDTFKENNTYFDSENPAFPADFRRAPSSPRLPLGELPTEFFYPHPRDADADDRPPTPISDEDSPPPAIATAALVSPPVLTDADFKTPINPDALPEPDVAATLPVPVVPRPMIVYSKRNKAIAGGDTSPGEVLMASVVMVDDDGAEFSQAPLTFGDSQPLLSDAPSPPRVPLPLPPPRPKPKKEGPLDRMLRKAAEKASAIKLPPVIETAEKDAGDENAALAEVGALDDNEAMLGLLSGAFASATEGKVAPWDKPEEAVGLPAPEAKGVSAEADVGDGGDENAEDALEGEEEDEEVEDVAEDVEMKPYRRVIESDDEEEEEEADADRSGPVANDFDPPSELHLSPPPAPALDDDLGGTAASQPQRRLETIAPRVAVAQPKTAYIEGEAAEEEDEFMGMGGVDGEDPDDDGPMVCSGDEDEVEDFDDIVELHRKQVLEADSKAVETLLNDVTTGNLRKRSARKEDSRGFTLSDSDDDEALLRKIRRKDWGGMKESRRADDFSHLPALQRMASKKETLAFARCFSSFQDDDRCLSDGEEAEAAPVMTVRAALTRRTSTMSDVTRGGASKMWRTKSTLISEVEGSMMEEDGEQPADGDASADADADADGDGDGDRDAEGEDERPAVDTAKKRIIQSLVTETVHAQSVVSSKASEGGPCPSAQKEVPWIKVANDSSETEEDETEIEIEQVDVLKLMRKRESVKVVRRDAEDLRAFKYTAPERQAQRSFKSGPKLSPNTLKQMKSKISASSSGLGPASAARSAAGAVKTKGLNKGFLVGEAAKAHIEKGLKMTGMKDLKDQMGKEDHTKGDGIKVKAAERRKATLKKGGSLVGLFERGPKFA
ncbi:hypothetical protein HK101_000947 [Irineochytrium annulatum]|nr:hypothetical protein HK101_000947 [Irineochytrium annulatum]